MQKPRLYEVVLRLAADTPGQTMQAIAGEAADWKTVREYVTLSGRVSWSLLVARLDFTKTLRDRAVKCLDAAVANGHLREEPGGRLIITDAGRERLRLFKL